MVRANAIYECQYYLGTSDRPSPDRARPSRNRQEGRRPTPVAHGATGKGNDQCRFELTYMALAPPSSDYRPMEDRQLPGDLPSRAEMIAYCSRGTRFVGRGLAQEAVLDGPQSPAYFLGSRNPPRIPGSIPTTKKNRGMFKLSVSPEDAPNKAEYVELDFEKGNCVAVDGKRLSPAGVLKTLNKLGGKHGVGRVDLVENRFVGMKSRGVYETPGGSILMHAHRQVESLTMDREVMHIRDSLIPKYAELVYYGFWFAPEREALQALIDESQRHVSGTVRLKLYKGNVITCGRKSKQSLYDMNIASMEGVKSWYNQSDATGFIRA